MDAQEIPDENGGDLDGGGHLQHDTILDRGSCDGVDDGGDVDGDTPGMLAGTLDGGTLDGGGGNGDDDNESLDEFLDDLDKWFDERLVLTETKKKLDDAGITHKTTTLVKEDKESLERINGEALGKNPQNDPEEFLQQLEVHERLHRLFEARELRKNILAAYLYITREFRWAHLCHMGSSLTPTDYEHDASHELPPVYQRLHKIPPHSEGLGDKSYEKTERLFPYFNKIRCPRKLRERTVKHYDVIELLEKRSICTGRYIVEVPFSRLLSVSGLRDVIPYENIRLVPYMLEWGHAEMNLGKPLRKPGSNSGLPSDYWDEPSPGDELSQCALPMIPGTPVTVATAAATVTPTVPMN
jgi:hypothetical protein